MTYITFSFDTEDYVNKNGADGILKTAEIMRKLGVKGCYNIVARLAEALKEWGRQDVIDALAHHEIETHSLAHSFHPTINEYTDLADYDEAMNRFLKEETEAVKIIKEVFGDRKISAACPPGNSTSYVAHYGYADMGIPCYDGDNLFDPVLHRPISCCNILCLDYVQGLVELLSENDEKGILEFLNKAAETDYMIVCNHPQNFFVTRFWDGMNFNGKNTPKENWVMAPTRTEAETNELFRKFEFLINAVKNDNRFKIVTYENVADIYGTEERIITKEMIPEIKNQLEDYFFPVTEPNSFSVSDVLLACKDFLLGEENHICKKVYGFLNTPYAITEPVTLSAEGIISAARQIVDGFLPEKITVDEKVIGPADWLRGALEVVCGAKEVVLSPANWQIDLDQFPFYRDLSYKNSWLHSPDFEDNYLSHRFRLQSWTIRLPKRTKRKIF